MLPDLPRRTFHETRLLVSLFVFCPLLFAQSPSQATLAAGHPSENFKQLITAIGAGEYYPDYPAIPQWLDGEHYTLLEPATAPAKGFDLVSYNAVSGGDRTMLMPAGGFIPKGALEPLVVESYGWSSDHGHLILFTNSRRVWRRNTRGDYWILDLATKSLTQLGGEGVSSSSLMFAKFSPDGRNVAYVRDNNLYVEDVATHTIGALTTDGSADVINGTSDWVDEEELDIRDAFRWSPDSRSIAFWQFDQSGVQQWTLIDDTSGPLPVTRLFHYPQVGTMNSASRIGIVDINRPAGITFLKLPGDAREHYLPHMDWVPQTRQLAVESLDRMQRDDRLYVADAATGEVRMIFQDTDGTFVDTVGFHGLDVDFTWLPSKGKRDAAPASLLWFSERDGWRHAYEVSLSAAGPAPRLLTKFNGDIISPVALDSASGSLFFTASPDDPIRAYLYSVKTDISGTPKRLSSAAEVGFHGLFQPSPDGKYAFEGFTSVNTAPRLALTRLADGRPTRVLAEYPALTAKIATLETPVEFTETRIGPHLSLSTMVIKPPHFDAAKKYPVFTYVYGEPAAQTVIDESGGHDLYLQAIAREGYVVLSFDNQGTPSPRGREWRHAGYGSLGVLSTQQQAAAIRSFADSHAYIDTTRMAIWGWSGGGTNTLNMMFRNPGLYSTGISTAPMPDQRRYDTIYQERYMGLPSTNAQGYHDGSAINYAEGLSGNLLIIHGSGDDNVHFAGTEALVNRLIEVGKTFDFMDYPGRTHDINEGKGTTIHLFTLIVRYLEDHVPAGPR